MRVLGVLLLACTTALASLATLVVIGIHGACDANCQRLLPIWPFAALAFASATLGLTLWIAGRPR
jgi:hypothetical protein